jgi:hypothetical protein
MLVDICQILSIFSPFFSISQVDDLEECSINQNSYNVSLTTPIHSIVSVTTLFSTLGTH